MRHSIVLFLILIPFLFILTPNTRAVKYPIQVLQVYVHADAANGWNGTKPGPTIELIQNETITITVEAHDHLIHLLYIEPYGESGMFGVCDATDSISVGNPDIRNGCDYGFGNFTYYDLTADPMDTHGMVPYPDCVGTCIVRPDMQITCRIFGTTVKSRNYVGVADFDGNGMITMGDINALIQLYEKRVWVWSLPLPVPLK